HVMKAMQDACGKAENYKYSLADLPELLRAVQYRYEKRFGVHVETDEIMSVYGSQEAMAHIGLTLCNPGDLILVPNPGYPMFEMSGIMAHAEIGYYTIEEKNGYLPDLDSIPKETLNRAKYMIVSYPLNPVCVCAPDDFYERLIRFAKENDIVILHDNAYSDITFTEKPGRSFLSFEGAKEVGVEFYSLSKSYNLTGARISFVVGNKEIVSKFRLLRSQIDYGIFYPVQLAAIAALTGPDDFIEEQRQEYGVRNRALCGGLRRIGWNVPDSQGTMFVWAKIPEGYESSADFCMKLMERTGVIVTPGSAFGSNGEGYVRMALVVDEEMISEILQVLDESGIFRK
ncbi:MAG TPA: aminotransferase class I/II-fold pyridoxal phosphate-dependent enzyme, partial [Candidatus Mediterraneibacter stercoravium]|nr:aminotransferase class I/II-fold pyridoxal phosphate-dependent enzyme [Candidatus Mediterraneibacter stercoravium]